MHIFRHFFTITRHRHRVIAHCFKAGIGFQGLFHDLSKYSPYEFFRGAKYYLGTRSPNEKERQENGYSLAWMHHKGRNRHHFEYWVDIDPETKVYTPVKMPLRFVLEMFCDRVAASKIYQGKNYSDAHPLEYFQRGKINRSIHKETSDFLESLLRTLKEKGEKETFRYIRQYRKTHRDY
ncbi:MAG: catalase [Clostridia bacterium]|nr:catalase [Clostridia bacterium]